LDEVSQEILWRRSLKGAGFPNRSLKVVCGSAIAPKSEVEFIKVFRQRLRVPKYFWWSAKGWVQWQWELRGWERWGGGDRQRAPSNNSNAADG